MQLDPTEAALIEDLRRLPHQTAQELTALVARLAALPQNTKIDWSEAWSEDDLKEFTTHSIRQLEVGEE